MLMLLCSLNTVWRMKSSWWPVVKMSTTYSDRSSLLLITITPPRYVHYIVFINKIVIILHRILLFLLLWSITGWLVGWLVNLTCVCVCVSAFTLLVGWHEWYRTCRNTFASCSERWRWPGKPPRRRWWWWWLRRRFIHESPSHSYAHDEQGVNPGQVSGFNGVLYKLWPLLMPWLAASRYQPRWRESRSRQMWLTLLADAAEVSIRWPGIEQSTGQGCRWTSASPGLVRQ